MAKHSYPVEGMTCAACVARVEKVVNKFDGVKNVSVNFATEKLNFEADNPDLDISKIQQAVKDYGYSIVIDKPKQNTSDSSNEITSREKKDEHYNKLKSDFIFAAIFTIPIFAISMLMDFEFFQNLWPLGRQHTNDILMVLTTPVIFISAKRFFVIFWTNLKHFSAEMNSLVAIGTGAAYSFSVLATLFPEVISTAGETPHVYFETSVVIVTLILMGRLLEARAKQKTSSAIKELLALRPKTAIVLENGAEREVNIDELKIDDSVVIKPGAKIPADGIIISGETSIDEAMVTGESIPIEKCEGDKVVGGTINRSGNIIYKVTATGESSFLGQIVKLVNEAQGAKVPIQKLADKIASVFTPIVILIALITFFVWLIVGGGFTVALIHFVAVLIVACPCALGLATPTAIMVGTGLGAKNGIIIRDGESLETAHKINTIIFDKTGTLTKGQPEVTAIEYFGESGEKELCITAAIEKKSEHPLAGAIIKYSGEEKFENYNIEKFNSQTGLGITASVDGKFYAIGNKKLMSENGYDIHQVTDLYDRYGREGKTPVLVFIDGSPAMILGLADPLKHNAMEAISRLNELGITTVLLSGDNLRTVKAIAAEVGITKFHGEILPSVKAEIVNRYRKEKQVIAMVGDGINDAPALAAADIGIALGGGTDVAIESAKVTILHDNIMDVVSLLTLSRISINAIKQNLFWAFIYNIIGIPLAAFGMLNPMIAALAMSFSSVSVVTNSLRLRGKKLK